MESLRLVFGDSLYVLPSVLFIGGILCGIIFQQVIYSKLSALAKRTKWQGDDIIVESLHNVLLLWFSLGGLYGAIETFPEMSHELRGHLTTVVLILYIVSGTHVVSKILLGYVKLYSNHVPNGQGSTSILRYLSFLVAYSIGFLIILETLGVSIAPILTALGVGGLALALALQETLSNLFAGIHIIAARDIQPGQFVELDTGLHGTVVDISWRNTTILTLGNNEIIIPNAKLAAAVITNYTKPVAELSVILTLGVAYDSDLNHVEKVCYEVAKETVFELEGGVADFDPLIRFFEFSDSSIQLRIVVHCREYTDQYPLIHELIKRLHVRFLKEGIVIPFPIRTVYMKQAH
ncbi:mechanosensitive ion channel protein MscS [Candidatus Peregrinibacteria bacterium CG_4_9_14_0_2_um_filter_53_11]|nr:MAG: mechanosensitive ion channel protein MscS [Candidatus Peregrinibacteria bacterium CG_4_9_14_0_2_um_filter_53_11]